MTVTFFSNFLNHHQMPFCEAMERLLGDGFTFVSTKPMDRERTALGWETGLCPSYEIRCYESKEAMDRALHLGRESDVVLIGSAPDFFIKGRLKTNKLIFRYHERVFKPRNMTSAMGKFVIKQLLMNFREINRNVYMLCASAYTARDYSLMGAYRGRCYKWGYFPRRQCATMKELAERKQGSQFRLVWVGRLIGLKHPDHMVLAAKRLASDGADFKLDILGGGPMEHSLRDMVKEEGLSDYVSIVGAVSPGEVRSRMEESHVFVFTSDFNEGWGCVLNEAMSSGCAVVASHAVGSAPFLVDHEGNGMLYRSGDVDGLYRCLKRLISDPSSMLRMGSNAYETIEQLWNADVAAGRLLQLADDLLAHPKSDRYETGPCSPAGILGNHWFKG